jgi:hypothetical protein
MFSGTAILRGFHADLDSLEHILQITWSIYIILMSLAGARVDAKKSGGTYVPYLHHLASA